jgi:hypothetical protein
LPHKWVSRLHSRRHSPLRKNISSTIATPPVSSNRLIVTHPHRRIPQYTGLGAGLRKLTVRNLRGDNGNGDIIRSPIRAIVLPDSAPDRVAAAVQFEDGGVLDEGLSPDLAPARSSVSSNSGLTPKNRLTLDYTPECTLTEEALGDAHWNSGEEDWADSRRHSLLRA